jgi:hypothetical protein
MAYDSTVPNEDNEVRSNDLPAMQENFEILADLVRSVRRAGPAGGGHIAAITMSASGEFETLEDNDGLFVLRVSGENVYPDARIEATVQDPQTGQTPLLFWSRVQTGGTALAYLQVPNQPVSGQDVVNKAYADALPTTMSGLDDAQFIEVNDRTQGQAVLWNTDGHFELGTPPLTLDDLTDVDAASPDGSGAVPRYNGSTYTVEHLSLGDLEDVDASDPTADNVLQANGATFVVQPLKIGGAPVVITSLTSGDILRFDGTNWVNVASDS